MATLKASEIKAKRMYPAQALLLEGMEKVRCALPGGAAFNSTLRYSFADDTLLVDTTFFGKNNSVKVTEKLTDYPSELLIAQALLVLG